MIALDRGGIVDEYLSVPEFYGPARARRRDRPRCEPDRARAPDGRRPAARPGGRADGRGIGRPAAGARDRSRRSPRRSASRVRARLRADTPTGSLGDVLTLYDAPRCPYCARVRIVLAEKAVPYETVVIDLADRPAWLLEHNPPDGRVPVLEEDGWVLPESAIVDEYLEERYPGTAAPAGRSRRARRRPARRLPLRRPRQAVLRAPPRGDGRRRAGRGCARANRRAAPRGSVPHRPRVRPRRRRVPPVAPPPPRPDGGLARPPPGARAMARDVLRASLGGRRGRDGRVARSMSDVTTDGARAAARRAGPRPPRRPAGRRSSPAWWSLRATRGPGGSRAPGASTSRASSKHSDVDAVRKLVGEPEGAEVIAYCHSGSRSAMAVQVLAVAGLRRPELRRLVARVVARPGAPGRDRPGGSGVAARRRGLARGEALRLVQERRRTARGRARSSAPRSAVGLGPDLLDRLRQLRRALDEPAVEHPTVDLGVELDAPRRARRAGTPGATASLLASSTAPSGSSKV